MSGRSRVLAVAGWGHTAEALSGLASGLAPDYDVTLTSVAELCSASVGPASALAELIRGMSPHCVIGWSMGAMVAVEVIASGACATGRLVLIAGTPKFCNSADYTCGAGRGNVRALGRLVASSRREAMSGFIRDCAAPLLLAPDVLAGRVAASAGIGDDTLASGLSYLLDSDLRGSLARLALPVLVLHGEGDAIVPVQAGEFLASGIPGALFRRHPGLGHSLPIDAPAACAGDIGRFLEVSA